MAAGDSGENKGVLSKNTHVTVGLVITAGILIIGGATWMQRIADDVGQIKGTLAEIVKDHEQRIRALESRK